jgi:hypothetical protein
VKDLTSGRFVFVKQDKSTKVLQEYVFSFASSVFMPTKEINKRLSSFGVPNVLSPCGYFCSPEEKNINTEYGWLAFPWVISKTLAELQKSQSLPLLTWIRGLYAMVETFAFTDPELLSSKVKLHHKVKLYLTTIYCRISILTKSFILQVMTNGTLLILGFLKLNFGS